MKFGAVAPKEAIGATAVHTIRQGALVLKKGTLIGPVEAAALDAAGIKDVVVARLEPGDVSEDVAAAEIATAIAGEGVTSIAPLPAAPTCSRKRAGVLVVDKDAVDGINRVDEAITRRDAVGLQAGRSRRDDRDRQDYSVRGCRLGAGFGACRSEAAAGSRCALPHPQSRRRVDVAARALAQGDRQDA